MSFGFQTRDDKPPLSASAIDQLLGGEAQPRTQVVKVTPHGAQTDAHELGGVADGSPSGHERRVVSAPYIVRLSDAVLQDRPERDALLGPRLTAILAIDALIYELIIADMVLKPF